MKTGFKIQIFILLLLFVFTGLTSKIYGQVSNTVGLNFGAFYPSSSGGFINIDASGVMSTSGVVHLGGSISAAQFSARSTGKNREITITIMNPVVQLNRVGGGGQMTLTIGPVSPSRYTHPQGNFNQIVRVGGRLSVGNITSNPPGNYNGEFTITFNNF